MARSEGNRLLKGRPKQRYGDVTFVCQKVVNWLNNYVFHRCFWLAVGKLGTQTTKLNGQPQNDVNIIIPFQQEWIINLI